MLRNANIPLFHLTAATVRCAASFAVMALALVLLACGGDSDTVNPTISDLQGSISVDGSSTVFPITEAVAEEFGLLTGRSVRITVGVSGTGGGFKKFCSGETDISDASRPIKASEVDACAENGIEFYELPVAIDGLTVVVHPDNEFANCITVDELHTLWAPEAEGEIESWAQVRSGWPDESISLYGPGVDSGTFDYFTETVNGESQASRGDFTSSEDDNVLVQGVTGDKKGLAYFGYAYFRENIGRLKALEIDGGAGCVAPTDQTINDGTYAPLARPLFVYVNKDSTERLEVAEFVRYYLSEEGWFLVGDVGYVPYPSRVYELVLARFENGHTGTIFGGGAPQTGAVESVLAANQ